MDKVKRCLIEALGSEKYMSLVRRRDEIRDGLASLARILLKQLEGRPGAMCLITGPPRSGTTAVRKWLGSHSDVIAFHESRLLVGVNSFFNETKRFKKLESSRETVSHLLEELTLSLYAKKAHPRRFSSKKILLDKEPLEPTAFPDRNYAEFIGNMREIYPKMKFIYMIRDPKATIWSMSQRKWGYSTTDSGVHEFKLEEHADNWNECAGIAEEYSNDRRFLVCSFNRLISSPERTSQEITRFLGLDLHEPFEPRPTKNPDFSKGETELIAERTGRLWKMLNERIFP